MKYRLYRLCMFWVFCIFYISMIPAQYGNNLDCWYTEDMECKLISLESCMGGYYEDRVDCENELTLGQIGGIDARNFLQKFYEEKFPDSQNKLISWFYQFDNTSLAIFILLAFILVISWKNFKVKSR